MFKSLLLASCLLVGALASPLRRQQQDAYHAVIELPADGTVIAPGASFPFHYKAMADYSQSTYNFSVWLFTDAPKTFAPSADFARGHYFGRFDVQNYPGVPYAQHPAPATLTMPNFSINPGGFGDGASAANVNCTLVVLEEWANGPGTVGLRMAMAMTNIMYNGTVASSHV